MSDADQRRPSRPLNQLFHEPVLALRIECCRCFIQNNDFRALKKQAHKSKALLSPPDRVRSDDPSLSRTFDRMIGPTSSDTSAISPDALLSAGSGYVTARPSDPIGIYGRCGRKNTFAPRRISIFHFPQGQSPAIARTSVLFPVPASPAISTRSPGIVETSASSTTAVLSSNVTERLTSLRAASVLTSVISMQPTAPGPSTASKTSVKPSTRPHGAPKPSSPQVADSCRPAS
jgi:hypothetical protein